jgi:hypothetical protein
MVWRRMGLLDDAIRDHLELKRLRGADPGEVAREQREALEVDAGSDPAAALDELGTALENVGDEADLETLPVRATTTVTNPSAADPDPEPSPAGNVELSNGGGETVELDMQTVMVEDEGGSVEQGSPQSPVAPVGPAGGVPSMDAHDGDQLEWEVPAESSGEASPDGGDRDLALGEDGR